jgi:hypothetical protein
MLNDGATWLAETLAENASQTVTYRRGSSSASVSAVIGRIDLGFSPVVSGVAVQRDQLDFIIRVADLELGGSAVEPQLNDTIDYGGRRYAVLRPDDQTPAFERDLDGLTFRIHTKYKADV